MANLRLAIGVLLGVVIVISTVTVFTTIAPRPAKDGGGEELAPLEGYFPNTRFTMPLTEGSVLELKIESQAVVGGEERNESGVYVLKVKGFEWPEVNVDLEVKEGNATPGPGVVVFSQLALPREFLGKDRISLPVFLPGVGAGVCMEFELKSRGGGLLVYEGATEVTSYVVKVRASYREDGIIAKFEAFVVGPDVNVKYSHELVRIDGVGETVVEAEWLCTGEGLSSDLRYVNEGLVVIENGRLEYISVEEFRRGLQGDAVFLVISKSCPFCQKDWSHMLKASEDTPVRFYAVIAGPLLGEEERKAALLEMNKAGVFGTPAFVAYKDGKIVDVKHGFMSYSEILSWIK